LIPDPFGVSKTKILNETDNFPELFQLGARIVWSVKKMLRFSHENDFIKTSIFDTFFIPFIIQNINKSLNWNALIDKLNSGFGPNIFGLVTCKFTGIDLL